MTTLSKLADLSAQYEILSRFFYYAHESYPTVIQHLTKEQLQLVLASVYGCASWKAIVKHLHPSSSQKLVLKAKINRNKTYSDALSTIRESIDANQPTVNLIKNLIGSIVSIEVRSDSMYCSWYFILYSDNKLANIIRNDPSLFPKKNITMGHLIDLSMTHFVLRSYSRFFSLAEPEVINNWIINKNQIIDSKVKFHLDLNMTSAFLNESILFKTFVALDPSQNEHHYRYTQRERINIVISNPLITAYERLINEQIDNHMSNNLHKQIHKFLIQNRHSINQDLAENNYPGLSNSELSSNAKKLIKDYLDVCVWILNQTINIPGYYSLFDIHLNQNGLFTVRSAYRNDVPVRPYNIFQKKSRTQPDCIYKKSISSFDMTKLLYIFIEQLKGRIAPGINNYIESINGAFDQFF